MVEEEATEVSSIRACLTKPCSACTGDQVTRQGTQALVAPQGTASTLSPCRPSLCPHCQGQEVQVF